MTTLYLLTPLAALIFAFLLIPVLRNLAFKIQLIDNPNYRKTHSNPVPLVGGIGIFIAAIMALGLAFPFEHEVFAFKNTLIAMAILLTMGMIDDRYDLSAGLKLAVQLILAHFIFVQGIKIESMHGLFGIYELSEWLQYALTILIIAGSINAFNLLDGIDGLAAGLAVLGFSIFAFLAFLVGQGLLALIFLTFTGALVGFLRFNFSKNKKVFMGDAGSLMIGFMLVVTGIQLVQFSQRTSYQAIVVLGVVAVMLVPVLDALRVFRKRIKSGKSPFTADRTHLHHLIMTSGLKPMKTTIGIISMIFTIIFLGVISYLIFGLSTAIVSMLLVFSVMTSILQFNSRLIEWRDKIKAMEKTM
jgi:UDP-GlcNAc:undecaprenyl-phosphate/decaprenyl-phosphate GlcNAc-1-phosphate transferase